MTIRKSHIVPSSARLLINQCYFSISFHNCEHACHVTMLAPFEFGDTLTRFGLAFSALIHDVDHS